MVRIYAPLGIQAPLTLKKGESKLHQPPPYRSKFPRGKKANVGSTHSLTII
jgi:hypothetical protein